MLRNNSAESGTNGTTVTTGNSASPDAFSAVVIGTTGALTFDSSQFAHYTLSYSYSTGGTAALTHSDWTSLGGITTLYWRAYVRVSAFNASQGIIRARSGGVQSFRVALGSTGKISIRDTANSTIATSSTTLSTGTWYRLEGYCTIGASSTAELKIYTTIDGTTAAETLTASAQNYGTGTIDETWWGIVTSTANVPQYWLDDIAVTDTGYLGPFGGQPTGIAVATALGTPATAMLGTAPSGLAVATALGQPTAGFPTSTPNGVAVAVALGSPATAVLGVAPSGLAVAVGLGQPTAGFPTAAPTGIAVAVALGSPATALLGVAPSGLAVPVALGQPAAGVLTFAPTGIAVAVALGQPVAGLVPAAPTGLAIAAGLGQPTSGQPTKAPSGIAVPVTVGTIGGLPEAGGALPLLTVSRAAPLTTNTAGGASV